MSIQSNAKQRGKNLEKRVAKEFNDAGIDAEQVIRTNFGKSDTDIKIKNRPWLKIDTKSRKRIGHHSLFEEDVIAKYCKNPEDEPIMPSCEKGKRDFYVMLRLPFLLKLLVVYFDYLDGKLKYTN